MDTGFREHSAQGMPVCKHCQQDLINWYSCKHHFRYRHCPILWLLEQDRQADTGADSHKDVAPDVQCITEVQTSSGM